MTQTATIIQQPKVKKPNRKTRRQRDLSNLPDATTYNGYTMHPDGSYNNYYAKNGEWRLDKSNWVENHLPEIWMGIWGGGILLLLIIAGLFGN